MEAVDFHFYLFIFVIASTGAAKRYDIEQQCKLDYGLSLDGVLRQFRRSDEYHKILEIKKAELQDLFYDVAIRSLEMYNNKMSKMIKAEFGIESDERLNPKTKADTTTTEAPAYLRLAAHRSRLRAAQAGRVPVRRDGDDDEQLPKIERIEQYDLLHTYLTTKERNKYRDDGFYYSGEVIHAIIRVLSGEPGAEPRGSTRGPGPDDAGTTASTTEHVKVHSPTSESKATVTESPQPAARRRLGD